MTIKYKCNGKNVYGEATSKITHHKHYDEHASMHYDCSGWSEWNETTWTVTKCSECGKEHSLKERDVL